MASRLQREIQQSRPFESLRVEAVLQMARTSATLVHRWEQYLRPLGITLTQYNVLRILRGAGEDGLPRSQVACRLVTPVPDVSRLLDRMKQAGLLTQARGVADRRAVQSRITRKGLEILERLDAPSRAVPDEALAHMDDSDVVRLIHLLEAARGGCNGSPATVQDGASQ